MIKVSVIIPTYNSSKYIREAIVSVLNQTYKNIEIIVIDDGSEDNTNDVLKDYIKSGAIEYFYKKNQGQASARNFGIKKSRGEIIAFLDADDLWLPEKLEKQIKKLQTTSADICFTDVEVFGKTESAGKRFSQIAEFHQGEILKSLIRTNFLVNSSILMKRAVFEKIGFQNEKRIYRNIEDYDYWIRAALDGINFVYLPEALTQYRIHRDQSSKNQIYGLKSLCAMYVVLMFNSKILAKGEIFEVIEMLARHAKTFTLLNLKSFLKKTLFYRRLLICREHRNLGKK